MYYGSKYFGIKLLPQERIYLYNRGDERVAVTGGWQVTGGNIIKQPSYIQFNQASDAGRFISTLNKIEFTNVDRLYLNIEVQAITNPAYGFNAFRSTVLSNGTRLKNTKSVRYPITEFQPNVPKTIMFFNNSDFFDFLSLSNNYANWKVHEVYIDKFY